MLKKLTDKSIPINGVGLQGHWSIYEPTTQELEESINKFASLGLKVQITELDLSVYPKEHERRAKKDTDKSEFTAEIKPLFDSRPTNHYRSFKPPIQV